ncbi:nucleoside hydrolase [Terrilactibacillus laevilacticus]|uniref:Nucleoside hydrolase n=1 Tax=Terrilactibacillus laevilacticus TaxID=1380157 RepID=A0ABW5PLQ6_9BACI|nr:nucleoside hydrolase [Terrilactibacillus laevilacticus]
MQKIIMDVDTGIDDALAIAYATSLPNVELLGVTTTYGMAPVAYSYRNTSKILEYLNTNIPVYKGSEKPLVRTREYSGKIHGSDGLGETLGSVDSDTSISSKQAIDFIIEQIYKYKKDLTIIATAPLTNLAKAIVKDPEIVNMIGKVVIMGGAFITPGNVTKFAEANIMIDPEAANIVFQSNLPITLVGLDVTRKTLLTNENVEHWRKKGTKLSAFFTEFTRFYLNSYKELHPYLKGCALHDPLAVGVAVNPELVKTIPLHIKVDLEDDALGRTTEDLDRVNNFQPNTNVCIDVDADKFMKHFFKHLLQIF